MRATGVPILTRSRDARPPLRGGVAVVSHTLMRVAAHTHCMQGDATMSVCVSETSFQW